MPDLDVSEVLLDPDFAETLTVMRRTEAISGHGRATITEVEVSPAPVGVVIPQNDAPVQRGPDQQTLPSLLQVHTPFRLRSVAPGVQPDVVIWNGDRYVVNKVYNFSHYGRGFIAADCSSQDLADNPPS